MRVLLFGASGGIGSEVRERARAAGHELVLFVRDVNTVEPLADESVVVATSPVSLTDFMVGRLTDDTYRRQAPYVSA